MSAAIDNLDGWRHNAFLTAAILVGVAKVGDALGLVSRIARVGIGADVARDTVTLGDIDSPLFELSRRFGRRRQKAFNLAFRAPTIVLFQTMTVFIGHAYPSLRLTAARLTFWLH